MTIAADHKTLAAGHETRYAKKITAAEDTPISLLLSWISSLWSEKKNFMDDPRMAQINYVQLKHLLSDQGLTPEEIKSARDKLALVQRAADSGIDLEPLLDSAVRGAEQERQELAKARAEQKARKRAAAAAKVAKAMEDAARAENPEEQETHTMDSLQAAFVLFDEDGSGELSRGEFKKALTREAEGEMDTSPESIDALFDLFDRDGNGEIDLDEARSHCRRTRYSTTHCLPVAAFAEGPLRAPRAAVLFSGATVDARGDGHLGAGV